MNGENMVFVDTNILIYAYSSDEVEKNLVVKKLFKNQEKIIISTQVVNEFINVMRKKRNVSIVVLKAAISEIELLCSISLITLDTIQSALEISQNYKYSYFDSLILASAIENSCSVLYSEDMQHTQLVNDLLVITNPFL